jgi:hypothetical protein
MTPKQNAMSMIRNGQKKAAFLQKLTRQDVACQLGRTVVSHVLSNGNLLLIVVLPHHLDNAPHHEISVDVMWESYLPFTDDSPYVLQRTPLGDAMVIGVAQRLNAQIHEAIR